jgi:cell wall-associated NlpC family hydrolase
LIRRIGAALFAAALIAAANGMAQATQHPRVHRVTRGETLASIAEREHITVEDLTRLNEIQGSPAAVPAGTVLALDPSASAAVRPAQFAPVSADAKQELRDLEVASNMPTANADLEMWSQDGFTVKSADPIHRFARGIINRTSSIALNLTRDAMRFIGTPYVFGGTTPSGFDCSGYVQYVFAMFGVHLPRTADVQYYAGHQTVGGIRTGDLVFFQTYLPGPSHVGIYMGKGKFIHSSSHGVMISRLADSYWASRYLGAKRVVALR